MIFFMNLSFVLWWIFFEAWTLTVELTVKEQEQHVPNRFHGKKHRLQYEYIDRADSPDLC